MTDSNPHEDEAYQFILRKIDSVPHLEALLLLWNSRPGPWTVSGVAQRLYITDEQASKLLRDLTRDDLIVRLPGEPVQYRFDSAAPEKDHLIEAVYDIYRHQLVRVSTLIHSKAPSAVRDFAQAFRITKERE